MAVTLTTMAGFSGFSALALAQVSTPLGLRACYPMPGTGIAYGASGLGACYAEPGTAVAYGPTDLQCPGLQCAVLR
eukprot:3537931-Rhodomonas_salina.5